MAGLALTGAVSLRSSLLAGAAAMVTATAVTISGVTASGIQSSSAQAPVLANVDLAAWANPVLEIFDTIQKTNLYLFSIAEPPATAFDRAGIIPDFLAAGFPVLTQYFLNAPDYFNQAVNLMFADYGDTAGYPGAGALRALTWAIDALPANIGLAVQQLAAGNLSFARYSLRFGIINPIQYALYQTLNSGQYVLGGFAARAAAVVTAVAEWIPTAIRSLADSATIVADATLNLVGDVVTGILTANPEKVWNSLVVGLLGTRSGPFEFLTPSIPDVLINQTIGEGGFVGATAVEAPSLRQIFTDLRDSIEEALATEVPALEPPPFNVAGPAGGISQIPTPWQPTWPFPPQVAASVPAPTSSVEKPTAATAAALGDGLAATADRPGPDVAVSGDREDLVADVSVAEPAAITANTAADSTRPTLASRTAVVHAAGAAGTSTQKPSRQAGARSAAR